ncbi:hypothetical protein GCM10027445_30980 [Amycolatopsis endophytica]|uniref:Uncharacterized protein n=1 Tax=Amycolatopsis endophytica TaxID=860233 RepID=A0A853BAT4_9PSEU|nr:hypothetical protein [Amycolatopsis endophytica]NYI91807.1 hypothetical protein [Amycolatopsis endophytica]
MISDFWAVVQAGVDCVDSLASCAIRDLEDLFPPGDHHMRGVDALIQDRRARNHCLAGW